MYHFQNCKKVVFQLFILSLFFSLSLHAQNKTQEGHWKNISPNGTKSIIVTLLSGKLYYSVNQGNDTIIKASPMGIEDSLEDFTQQLSFSHATSKKIDEHYTMVIGKRAFNHNWANETTLNFTNRNNKPIKIIARAYNDGVAFRYAFPVVNKSITVTNEITSFKVPVNGSAWLMPYGHPTDYAPAYENDYSYDLPVNKNAPDSSGWAFPALFNSNGHFILITEADLDANFYASHLQQNCTDGVYKIARPLEGEAHGLYNTTATSTTPFATPWRTIIFGKSLGTIIESNLVYHLSAANKTGDASWVKPGRSSWSWWGDHESSKSFSSLKKFIDLSKNMGWEYSMVDANWDLMEDGGTIEDLVKYAKKQKILLSLWYNSGGEHNPVSERPRDIMSDPVKRKAEFKKLNKWGIKAVKVDFFNSDKQQLIKLYIDILKDAAAYKIMVDFHGCTLPRGWSRTYPNLITMEAIKGAEQYGWDSTFAVQGPAHNIVAMCTRNVVGPMDYTPVTFSDYSCCPHVTSNAHELATSVLFESGMLHFADRVAPYMGLDTMIKQFLKIVPVTWDDTKYIDGYPGKLMVMARQKGKQWFVGAANGEAKEKNIVIDFSFLRKGSYTLLLMKDGENSREIIAETLHYTDGKPLTVKVLPNGGFTIWIKEKE